MKKISSSMTFFYKRIFPAIWFGMIGLVFFGSIVGFIEGKGNVPIPFLIMPVFMGTVGYFMFKNLLFDLIDEVFDSGEYLLVRNKGQEEKILFSNIKNVSYANMVNPPRITVSLRDPIKLGKEISFMAPFKFSLNPFQKSPLVEDLIARVDQSRYS